MLPSPYSSLLEEIQSLYHDDFHNPVNVVNTLHFTYIFTLADFKWNDTACRAYRILKEEADVSHIGNYIMIIYLHMISKESSIIF
jgi:hypothetical protein